MRRLLLFVLTLRLTPLYGASSPADPSQVLVIVQDNTGPETGTGGANASQWVADHYMAARGIPAGNVLHIATYVEKGNGTSCSPGGTCILNHPSSTVMTYQQYLDGIETPLKTKLAANSGALAASIRYIVPVYGVPYQIRTRTVINTADYLSIDATISCLNQTLLSLIALGGGIGCINPYWRGDLTSGDPAHLDAFTSTGKLYVTVRLDGPSALIAAGLVDKAIAAETNGINRASGIGYFDWQGGGQNNEANDSMAATNTACMAVRGLRCSLNDQSSTGGLITSAPNTLWAWGWYSGTAVNDVYTFAPGAVGAQFTSYTANFIREQGLGSWVPLWLLRGITATWGNTGEPSSQGRGLSTFGDVVLGHLWKGYTFGESYALGTYTFGWMSIGLGDPLYRLKLIGPSHLGSGAKLSGGATIH